MQLLLAIRTAGLVPKSATGYKNTCYEDRQDLINHIHSGGEIVACHLKNGHRLRDNYIASNVIVYDSDNDIPLEDFWKIPFVRRHCLFTNTTKSHGILKSEKDKERPTLDRFRAYFVTHSPLSSPDVHAEIYRRVTSSLGIDIQDNCGSNPVQPFFGNPKASVSINPDAHTLPWDWEDQALDTLSRKRSIVATPSSADDLDIAAAIYLLTNLRIQPTRDGEYERWNKVWQACASTGDPRLFEAIAEWTSAGHHSHQKTPKKLEKDWSKAGARSGLSALWEIAREENGNCNIEDLLSPQLAEQWKRRFRKSKHPTKLFTQRENLQFVDVPDTAPSTEGAQILLSNAQLRNQQTPPDDLPPDDRNDLQEQTADHYRTLLNALYLLITEGKYHLAGVEHICLNDEDYAVHQALLRGHLLENQAYQRSPGLIDAALISIFESKNGLEPVSRFNIRARKFQTVKKDLPELIPGLLHRGCSYLLFGKAGVGKTTLALMLARVCVGAPGHDTFLGFGPVPATRWRQERALIIATDGESDAEHNLTRYARWHKMTQEDWLRNYVDVIAANADEDSRSWRMDLLGLYNLDQILHQAREDKMPYGIIIIDSLKAVCADGLRVGSQEIIDYTEIVSRIGRKHGVAIFWIHHQSRDGDYAQGVTGLEERMQGVCSLHVTEDKRHLFKIKKTRAEFSGGNEFFYKIEDGDLHLQDENDDSADRGESLIRLALQRHLEQWREQVRLFGVSHGNYGGLPAGQLWQFLRQEKIDFPEWTERKVADLAREMVQNNELIKIGDNNRRLGYALPNTDPRAEQVSQSVFDPDLSNF